MSDFATVSVYPSAGEPPPRKLAPPSKFLLFSEWRWIYEFGLTIAAMPLLMTAKRGAGHPVLVLPGFLTSDTATRTLRRYLSNLGYDVRAWGFGRNVGGVYSNRKRLRQLLATIAKSTGTKVSIVGWSLGGIYARDLALSMPEQTRDVITLGSPFAIDITATSVSDLYTRMTGESSVTMAPGDFARLSGKLPVPTTAIYTKTDGIVNYRASQVIEDERSENIEVLGSHLGLGVNAAALWAIADRLAQPPGTFTPFDRGGPFRLGYPQNYPWLPVG